VRPPVMPLRPDNPAAEKDGDWQAVFFEHRSKAVIAPVPVVERNDQGLSGKALGRLAGPRCQEGGKRRHVVTASKSAKMSIRARRLERVINDDRRSIALPYLTKYQW